MYRPPGSGLKHMNQRYSFSAFNMSNLISCNCLLLLLIAVYFFNLYIICISVKKFILERVDFL